MIAIFSKISRNVVKGEYVLKIFNIIIIKEKEEWK